MFYATDAYIDACSSVQCPSGFMCQQRNNTHHECVCTVKALGSYSKTLIADIVSNLKLGDTCQYWLDAWCVSCGCQGQNKLNYKDLLLASCFINIWEIVFTYTITWHDVGEDACKSKTHMLEDYNGRVNISASGKACLPWKDQPGYSDTDFPLDGSLQAAKNYCLKRQHIFLQCVS